MHRAAQQRGKDEACPPRCGSLRLAQDDGLENPLLGASPGNQWCEAAEEVAAIWQRANPRRDAEGDEAEDECDRHRAHQPRPKRTPREAPFAMLPIVTG